MPPQLYTALNCTRNTILARRVAAATASKDRRRGLLSRTSLDAGEGLRIAPCEAIHTFGMKIPIDAIFLDKACRVRRIRHSIRSCRIAVCLSAHSVLEIAAGAAALSGTQVGDRIEFVSQMIAE
jgi:uncharacterized membrane protein (UPF0127 family)